jgi:SAM-dependent methyltransferase
MNADKELDEKEVKRINLLQSELFSELAHLFDPPLPEGVPLRLEKIVASADIARGDVILDVGTGTGILIPLIQPLNPKKIFACDLSKVMLARLKEHYKDVETILADVRDLTFPDLSIDVVFINACYPNIVDKRGAFTNISRMMKKDGHMVISHPMGKSFVDLLKEKSPFPLDDFPDRPEAENLFKPYGFDIKKFVDEPDLYILLAVKRLEC